MPAIRSAILIVSMLDDVARERGYENGVQDLVEINNIEENRDCLEEVYRRLREMQKQLGGEDSGRT